MSTRAVVRALCWLAILVPLTVTSTPPAPPPLRSYRVHGQLLDSGGQPVSGATVTLAGRCYGTEYALLDPDLAHCGCIQKQGTPSSHTDANGDFSINLVSCQSFDSLAFAVLQTDTVITDDVVSSSDAEKEAWKEDVPSESQGFFFCATSTGFTTVQVGWIYSFPSETVTLNPARARRGRQ
jgi:hypothetical protein